MFAGVGLLAFKGPDIGGRLWGRFGFYGFNPGTMAQIIAADGTSFSSVRPPCGLSWGLD